MTHTIRTLELAKLYESQGHYSEAHDIYSALYAEASDSGQPMVEIRAGLERTQNTAAKKQLDGISLETSENKMAELLEKWLMLLVVQQRLENFKKIKKRLL